MVVIARTREMTPRCSAFAFAVIVNACGCQGPIGVKATPGESSSSDGGGATTSAATSNDNGSDPSRPVPPPFVLPAGCGDGVIVPGQYDCFFPVPFDWVDEKLGDHAILHPLDFDDDGRDEMIAYRGGKNIAVLRWDGSKLELGPLIDTSGSIGSSTTVQTRWDWTGDGLRDVTLLVKFMSPLVWMHPNLEAEGLGEKALMYEAPRVDVSQGFFGAVGHTVIDVDGDGTPEVLASMIVDGFENSNPSKDLVLLRRMGTTWEPVGEAYRWGPCGWLNAFAYGDFDGDGDEDIAVLDHGQACDPYPSSYDPEWYRVGVLLANAEEGVLELGGWYPTGGVVEEPAIWAEDVTGDGRLDLIVEIGDPLVYGVAVMRGRGDGSFQDGVPVDLSPTLPAYEVSALIDVDGDGKREWIHTVSKGRPWVIPFDFSKEGVAPMVALNDPEANGTTRFKEPIGDINGDGVDDYSVGSHVEGSLSRYTGDFLMLSAP